MPDLKKSGIRLQFPGKNKYVNFLVEFYLLKILYILTLSSLNFEIKMLGLKKLVSSCNCNAFIVCLFIHILYNKLRFEKLYVLILYWYS